MSGAVLVLVEPAAGDPSAADALSLEALAFARGVADALGASVEAVVFGPGASGVAAGLGVHGVATVHLAEDPRIGAYSPDAWAAGLAGLVSAGGTAAVLGPGSDRGAEVLARLAARLDLPLAANVVSAAPGEGEAPWTLTRQRWAGSLLEDATLTAPVALMTVAAHVVAIDERAGTPVPAVVPFRPDLPDADLVVRVTGREAAATGRVSLTDAKVVVSGGRGVGSAEGFAPLEELAALLGGAVGVSRVVTSAGWRPHADQVGQTGARVAPDLYIACGISGAIQHIVGMKAAKHALAINTDPDAPIMSVADFAVIGDLHQVVPAISAEIRRRTGSSESA